MHRGIRTPQKATIKQVAALAHVSIQTVSRVLNDHPYVSHDARERVLDAMRKLEYRPDAIARSLITGRSSTIGVVAAELEFYGPHRLLIGIEKQAAALGYSLLLSIIHNPEPDNGARQLESLLSRQVDGIIWNVPEVDSNQAWSAAMLRAVNVPIIFVTAGAIQGLSTIVTDGRGGGRLATEHLLAQGYRQIGLLSGPQAWAVTRERQLGWQEALAAWGLPTDERRIVEGDWSAESGERGLRRLIEQFPEIDAVFALNDQMALGALQAAHLVGRRVPEDLGVVGFDAIPESAYFWPALTSVRQHHLNAGSAAVRELSRVIDLKQKGQDHLQSMCVVIQPELVIRKSSVLRSS